MTQLTILGEEVKITFNMACELAFEEISGEAFSVESLGKTKNTVALDMAVILTANPDTKITIDRLLHEASGYELGLLNKAVYAEMTAWLQIPKVITDEEAKEPIDEDEEKPKN